jgi:hypothetical protein
LRSPGRFKSVLVVMLSLRNANPSQQNPLSTFQDRRFVIRKESEHRLSSNALILRDDGK